MKICNNASKCCYGHCLYGNVCGYSEDMKQEDECPQWLENEDVILEELQFGKCNNYNEDVM